MSASRLLVLGVFFLRYISLASADAVSTDELSLFDENIDPLQSAYFLDATNPDLVSDTTFNEDSDLFNTLPNGPGSDLFASDADLNPINDPNLIADCNSIQNGYLRKKARARRQTCSNPASDFNPNLSLPTLDQISPLGADQEPSEPESEREKAEIDVINGFILRMGSMLRATDIFLRSCVADEKRVCSSGDEQDVELEENKITYTLTKGTPSKFCFPVLISAKPLSVQHVSHADVAL